MDVDIITSLSPFEWLVTITLLGLSIWLFMFLNRWLKIRYLMPKYAITVFIFAWSGVLMELFGGVRFIFLNGRVAEGGADAIDFGRMIFSAGILFVLVPYIGDKVWHRFQGNRID